MPFSENLAASPLEGRRTVAWRVRRYAIHAVFLTAFLMFLYHQLPRIFFWDNLFDSSNEPHMNVDALSTADRSSAVDFDWSAVRSLVMTPLRLNGNSSFVVNDEQVKPHKDLQYTPCYGILQCARLELPLDWQKPEGKTIGLAVARLPAAVDVHDPRKLAL